MSPRTNAPEKRVDDRVENNVPVAMRNRRYSLRHFNARQNQLPSRLQAVNVVPLADARQIVVLLRFHSPYSRILR